MVGAQEMWWFNFRLLLSLPFLRNSSWMENLRISISWYNSSPHSFSDHYIRRHTCCGKSKLLLILIILIDKRSIHYFLAWLIKVLNCLNTASWSWSEPHATKGGSCICHFSLHNGSIQFITLVPTKLWLHVFFTVLNILCGSWTFCRC